MPKEQPSRTPNREARRAAIRALPKGGDECAGLVEIDLTGIDGPKPLRAWRGSQISVQEYLATGSSSNIIARVSVRRHDGGKLKDHWQTLFRIKTLLYPWNEAVEVHPPKAKLVDDAPMWHLWILEDAATVGADLA
jgi:hypothetical protein